MGGNGKGLDGAPETIVARKVNKLDKKLVWGLQKLLDENRVEFAALTIEEATTRARTTLGTGLTGLTEWNLRGAAEVVGITFAKKKKSGNNGHTIAAGLREEIAALRADIDAQTAMNVEALGRVGEIRTEFGLAFAAINADIASIRQFATARIDTAKREGDTLAVSLNNTREIVKRTEASVEILKANMAKMNAIGKELDWRNH